MFLIIASYFSGGKKSLCFDLVMILLPLRAMSSTFGLATMPSTKKSPHCELKPIFTFSIISCKVPTPITGTLCRPSFSQFRPHLCAEATNSQS